MPQSQRNGDVSNSSSNPSLHNVEETMRRLRIQTDEKEGSDSNAVASSRAYPDRPGEPDCIYYLRTGLCGYGNNCRFNHPTSIGQANINQHAGELPERTGEPDCVYFLKTGTCKYGSRCKYNHPRDRRGAGPVILNMFGLPMRQDEKSCPHYIRTGSCKFGVSCKFHHPQPAPDGSYAPVSGSLAYASSIAPSSGISPWPLPRATYVSDPLVQTPQTYFPIVVPPAQGIGPSQGWSTYMGSLSPVFTGSGSAEHTYPLLSASQLPERPGEPECRYFMNTGNCKYGSDCKYHHPREKIAQLAASSLGPLGLPLRPGQAICSYYSLYGICKYGPTCKYDHPLVGYSYNYNMNLANQSVPPDPNSNSPMLHSPDSSLKSGNQDKDAKAHGDSSNGSSSHMVPASESQHDQSD